MLEEQAPAPVDQVGHESTPAPEAAEGLAATEADTPDPAASDKDPGVLSRLAGDARIKAATAVAAGVAAAVGGAELVAPSPANAADTTYNPFMGEAANMQREVEGTPNLVLPSLEELPDSGLDLFKVRELKKFAKDHPGLILTIRSANNHDTKGGRATDIAVDVKDSDSSGPPKQVIGYGFTSASEAPDTPWNVGQHSPTGQYMLEQGLGANSSDARAAADIGRQLDHPDPPPAGPH